MHYYALGQKADHLKVIAVDIGYSRNAKSCGIAWPGGAGKFRFGEAIGKLTQLFADEENREAVLVLEAVLSTYHNENGNPDVRGEFENGRGWYIGPGAVTYVAAVRLLSQLAVRLGNGGRILVAEAFLSNKVEKTGHADDAVRIKEHLWLTDTVILREGVEPGMPLITGVPPVRCF